MDFGPDRYWGKYLLSSAPVRLGCRAGTLDRMLGCTSHAPLMGRPVSAGSMFAGRIRCAADNSDSAFANSSLPPVYLKGDFLRNLSHRLDWITHMQDRVMKSGIALRTASAAGERSRSPQNA